ncbi:hypothetical protein [Priestia megaterium]|uniref:hypothetical protein n=1 Tax=Priestia megaterium TaxID=1404 RepID=UPI001783B9DA|nr:hypothetical protein [Priestia megaterium]MBD8109668.1 hypothetical protein [Priestia megaterium]
MYIQYRMGVKGIIEKQLWKLNPISNEIDYVELFYEMNEKLSNNLFVTFYFSSTIKDVDEAENITRPLLDDLINLMIYKFNAIFDKPIINSHNIEEKVLIARGSITLYKQKQHVLNEQDYTWLSTKINDQHLVTKLKLNTHFLQYKSILSIEDDIARFLLLYGLLYEMQGCSQRNVDQYIKSEDSNVKMLTTTRPNSNSQETIYTWWRNQAQHIQTTTDIEQVTEEFRNLVNSLNELVFKAIENEL